MQVKSSATLADPKGPGPELPAGVPVEVDESDKDIKALLDGGYLVPVDAQGDVQEWNPGDAGQQQITPNVAGSDLATTGEIQPKSKK